MAIKRNEVLICAATWINFENVVTSETGQTQKDACCMTAVILGVTFIEADSRWVLTGAGAENKVVSVKWPQNFSSGR